MTKYIPCHLRQSSPLFFIGNDRDLSTLQFGATRFCHIQICCDIPIEYS